MQLKNRIHPRQSYQDAPDSFSTSESFRQPGGRSGGVEEVGKEGEGKGGEEGSIGWVEWVERRRGGGEGNREERWKK